MSFLVLPCLKAGHNKQLTSGGFSVTRRHLIFHAPGLASDLWVVSRPSKAGISEQLPAGLCIRSKK